MTQVFRNPDQEN